MIPDSDAIAVNGCTVFVVARVVDDKHKTLEQASCDVHNWDRLQTDLVCFTRYEGRDHTVVLLDVIFRQLLTLALDVDFQALRLHLESGLSSVFVGEQETE